MALCVAIGHSNYILELKYVIVVNRVKTIVTLMGGATLKKSKKLYYINFGKFRVPIDFF